MLICSFIITPAAIPVLLRKEYLKSVPLTSAPAPVPAPAPAIHPYQSIKDFEEKQRLKRLKDFEEKQRFLKDLEKKQDWKEQKRLRDIHVMEQINKATGYDPNNPNRKRRPIRKPINKEILR